MVNLIMKVNKRVFVILLILTVASNPFLMLTQDKSVKETMEFQKGSSSYAMKKSSQAFEIGIIYDSTDKTTIKAFNQLYKSLSETPIKLKVYPVYAISQLTEKIHSSIVNIYIVHGTSEGLNINSEQLNWRKVAELLEISPKKHYIFQSCYSDQLKQICDTNLNIYGLHEQVDYNIAQMNTLSILHQIMEETTDLRIKLYSKSILSTTTQYFLDNLDHIILRSFIPEETLDGGFEVDFQQSEAKDRGSWGFIVQALLSLLLSNNINSNDWYSSNSTSILFDTAKIATDLVDSGKISLTELGKGTSETGKFPFDIPLDIAVAPKMGSGPWYMPDYVDLTIKMQAEGGSLDLTEVLGLKKMVEAAGYSVKLTLDPRLSATLRIGNVLDQMATANPILGGNPFQFMGGKFSIDFGLELGIPLVVVLDGIIPSAGSTIASILKALNIKINLVNYLSLGLGMNYNSQTDASQMDVNLKAGMGLDVSFKLPSPKEYIKKAIGVSLPVDFIKLGSHFKVIAGVLAKANFGHDSIGFEVGLFYNALFKFWASLFWIFKFSCTKKWDDSLTIPLDFIPGTSNPPSSTQNTNLDIDGDGLWDDLEDSIGLNKNQADTDGDTLSDGNEVMNFFSDPLKKDSDGDGLDDATELAEFFYLGLDALADYDNDGKPCILDPDSDNDGLNDKWEIKGKRSPYWMTNITTDPSLPDTDFDGFTDGEEWDFAGPQREAPHPHPRRKDSDNDGLNDFFEYEWYNNEFAFNVSTSIINILTADVDNDKLLDGEEYCYKTDPTDIDTDGDFDLDDDNFLNQTELDRANNSLIVGDFTDWGEIHGNTWEEWPWGMPECAPLNPTPTNPLNPDTDHDGISDVIEFRDGTLPVQEDSDGDGLPNTVDKYDFHANCSDPDHDDDYLRDGDEVYYFNIIRGISNTTIQNEQYLNNSDIDNDGILDGLELRIGTDPLNPDTDEDGLWDGSELEANTYPLLPDSDGDGLLDGPEVYDHFTNPLRQDTDNDGLFDAVEVQEQHLYLQNIGNISFFTDPNDPDTDDDTLTDGEEVYGWNWALDRRVPEGDVDIVEPIIDEDGTILINPLYGAPDPYRARFQTNPVHPDTDNDGLFDGFEKEIILSPLANDTDGDGWFDIDEINYMTARSGLPWDQVPDIWHYLDYDMDGLTDMVEFERGTDMLLEDTDGDGLSDWDEVRVPISYGSSSFGLESLGETIEYSTNTSLPENQKYTDPLVADTDGDNLNDLEEILNGTDPLLNDTDGDGLSDYTELVGYQTTQGLFLNEIVSLDPLNNDTDADGIIDAEEVNYFSELAVQSGNSAYAPLSDFDGDGIKNIFDYDSDNDGIYDGFEVDAYLDSNLPWYPVGTDPFYADQDLNGILDGYQTDFDMDGLSDYAELTNQIPGYTYVYLGDENSTYRGYEHILNHTLCGLNDTDGDGFLDGYELSWGSDPLNSDNYPLTFQQPLPLLGFEVGIATCSQISGFMFNEAAGQLEFIVSGPSGTRGFCNVSIPRALLDVDETGWDVLIDNEETDYEMEVQRETTILHFSYSHSEHQVVIRGTEILSGMTTDTISSTSSTKSSEGFQIPFASITWIGLTAMISIICIVMINLKKQIKDTNLV